MFAPGSAHVLSSRKQRVGGLPVGLGPLLLDTLLFRTFPDAALVCPGSVAGVFFFPVLVASPARSTVPDVGPGPNDNLFAAVRIAGLSANWATPQSLGRPVDSDLGLPLKCSWIWNREAGPNSAGDYWRAAGIGRLHCGRVRVAHPSRDHRRFPHVSGIAGRQPQIQRRSQKSTPAGSGHSPKQPQVKTPGERCRRPVEKHRQPGPRRRRPCLLQPRRVLKEGERTAPTPTALAVPRFLTNAPPPGNMRSGGDQPKFVNGPFNHYRAGGPAQARRCGAGKVLAAELPTSLTTSGFGLCRTWTARPSKRNPVQTLAPATGEHTSVPVTWTGMGSLPALPAAPRPAIPCPVTYKPFVVQLGNLRFAWRFHHQHNGLRSRYPPVAVPPRSTARLGDGPQVARLGPGPLPVLPQPPPPALS